MNNLLFLSSLRESATPIFKGSSSTRPLSLPHSPYLSSVCVGYTTTYQHHQVSTTPTLQATPTHHMLCTCSPLLGARSPDSKVGVVNMHIHTLPPVYTQYLCYGCLPIHAYTYIHTYIHTLRRVTLAEDCSLLTKTSMSWKIPPITATTGC